MSRTALEVSGKRDALVDAAHAEISRLCHGKRWQMTIPLDEERDSDVIIGNALRALKDRIAELEKDAERYAKLKDAYSGADFEYPLGEGNGDDDPDTCCVIVFDLPLGANVSTDLNATIDAWPLSGAPMTGRDNG
jgi:hypothetical protein